MTDARFDIQSSQVLLKSVGRGCSLQRLGPTVKMQFAEEIPRAVGSQSLGEKQDIVSFPAMDSLEPSN